MKYEVIPSPQNFEVRVKAVTIPPTSGPIPPTLLVNADAARVELRLRLQSGAGAPNLFVRGDATTFTGFPITPVDGAVVFSGVQAQAAFYGASDSSGAGQIAQVMEIVSV